MSWGPQLFLTPGVRIGECGGLGWIWDAMQSLRAELSEGKFLKKRARSFRIFWGRPLPATLFVPLGSTLPRVQVFLEVLRQVLENWQELRQGADILPHLDRPGDPACQHQFHRTHTKHPLHNRKGASPTFQLSPLSLLSPALSLSLLSRAKCRSRTRALHWATWTRRRASAVR